MFWIIKNKMVLTLAFVMLLGSLLVVPGASAQTTNTSFGIGEGTTFGDSVSLGSQPLETTIASIINVILSLLGIVAVCLILYGGFKWMTAGGAEEGVADAKKIIFSGIIGLLIILSAYAIARFVLSNLATATGTGSAEGL